MIVKDEQLVFKGEEMIANNESNFKMYNLQFYQLCSKVEF